LGFRFRLELSLSIQANPEGKSLHCEARNGLYLCVKPVSEFALQADHDSWLFIIYFRKKFFVIVSFHSCVFTFWSLVTAHFDFDRLSFRRYYAVVWSQENGSEIHNDLRSMSLPPRVCPLFLAAFSVNYFQLVNKLFYLLPSACIKDLPILFMY
jgi:hypothetical protein